ncbi:MAG: hypothetical protein ABFD92_08425 [Planctomycetaceae bacterium]|nr:hypothetical protein [Planctomycetaceae bacterium]
MKIQHLAYVALCLVLATALYLYVRYIRDPMTEDVTNNVQGGVTQEYILTRGVFIIKRNSDIRLLVGVGDEDTPKTVEEYLAHPGKFPLVAEILPVGTRIRFVRLVRTRVRWGGEIYQLSIKICSGSRAGDTLEAAGASQFLLPYVNSRTGKLEWVPSTSIVVR